jgi:hypothetical protein
MAPRITQLRRLEQLEAAVGSEDAAPAAPALSEAVLAYLRSYGVEPPTAGVWKPWPEEQLGLVHSIYALVDRRQRGGTVPTLLEVQRELLTTSVLTVAWQRAREAKDAGRADTVLLTHDGTVAACREVFVCDDAERLAGDLWADPAAWVLAWREVGTDNPELLATMKFTDAEIMLLNTISG